MSQPLLYSVEREFPVRVSTLWSAWTKAEELENWYHPTNFAAVKGATVSALYLGGIWACGVDVQPHNFVAFFYGKYIKIEEFTVIEHTMHYTESKLDFDAKDLTTPSHLVVINFEDRGENSWVKFSQFGDLPAGEEKRAQAGMESYLDSLALYLKGGQTPGE